MKGHLAWKISPQLKLNKVPLTPEGRFLVLGNVSQLQGR